MSEKNYDDIIFLEYPFRDDDHPKMSLHERAAQFAPFAALAGYEELIDETWRSL